MAALILALVIYILVRNHMSAKLKKAHEELKVAYDQLEETTAVKERMESELRIARNIQMSMVPSVFPDVKGLDMYASMTPAKEVGDNQSNMFVTLWLGLVDLTTGHLSFCNAGHNPPIIGCGGNEVTFLEMLPNVPIGILPGVEYMGEEMATIKGRPLLIYTIAQHAFQLGTESH